MELKGMKDVKIVGEERQEICCRNDTNMAFSLDTYGLGGAL
jgi:hypothetical protein